MFFSQLYWAPVPYFVLTNFVKASHSYLSFSVKATIFSLSFTVFPALLQQSPSGVTQDCNQLMNGLFSQTLSVGNPLIEQTTSTHSIEMSGSEHHAAPERAAASG